MRKKSAYATNGHWFGDKFPLEKIGDNDWHQFVKNVCNYPNWIQEYFDMYVGPYQDKIEIGKSEEVEQELMRILDKLGEPYQKDKILGKGKEPHRARPLGTMSRLRTLSKQEINNLYATQKITFEKYGYTKDFS